MNLPRFLSRQAYFRWRVDLDAYSSETIGLHRYRLEGTVDVPSLPKFNGRRLRSPNARRSLHNG